MALLLELSSCLLQRGGQVADHLVTHNLHTANPKLELLLSVQQFDWPRPLHGYCSTTAIDEGLARLLTILCHVHATQSKLAAAIKNKDLHITSVSTNSND